MEKVFHFSVMLQWKNYKYYFVNYNQLLHILLAICMFRFPSLYL